jgi:hypothetical protein
MSWSSSRGPLHFPRFSRVLHVRNFGSFAAIRTGLQAGQGEFFAVIAADLQEPPSLLLQFLDALLQTEADVIVGVREARDDPAASRVAANIFWRLYRRFVNPDMPEGGVDLFGCTRRVRNELLQLRESNSSLVGLIFWLGFRRKEIGYTRLARPFGRSSWTFKKKFNYLLDSIFSFSDLPVRILSALGIVGLLVATVLGILVAILRLLGKIDVPGYAATLITVMFFGALNTLGLGLIGAYAWRTYENTKQRPLAIVESAKMFEGALPLRSFPHPAGETDGVRLEDDVYVGPNATFTNDRFPRSKAYPTTLAKTIVRQGASIGANATILPGLEIGAAAMVGAGAVVTRSVPPNAVVVGNPAHITGYVNAPELPAPALDAANAAPEDRPSAVQTGIGKATIHELRLIEDLRGTLSVGEFAREIPFIPKRYFTVFGVPSQEVRGEHAHKVCHQFLVCVSGSVSVLLDDGKKRCKVQLDRIDMGVYISPMVWSTQYRYSPNCILLVFASHHYDPNDYIRSYKEYLDHIRENPL